MPLSLLGIRDVSQPHHALLRNYPLVSHLRWMFETARPYLRQYIVEGDLSGAPYAEWWAAASAASFQPLQHTGRG
ncbi:hypothetical protein [Marinobacterium rhizophilum]|uniref:hypothetical protein n=1 Tax=Marinobacterium rhizophilum TaxID=420402 RepID=UPI0003728136|nr:hypothetical protein [Marinobacterium rhizophilum]